MSRHEWLALAAVIAGLSAILPLVRILAARVGASAEVSRKTIHVSMGLACMSFPWLFDSPLPVWLLAITASSRNCYKFGGRISAASSLAALKQAKRNHFTMKCKSPQRSANRKHKRLIVAPQHNLG